MSESDPVPPTSEPRDATSDVLVRFFSLLPGEEIVFSTRPARVRSLIHIIGALLVWGLVFVADANGLGFYAFPDLFLTTIVGIAAAVVIARAVLIWLRVRYIVTTRRLVVRGLLSVVVSEPLERITGVEIDRTVLGERFGYAVVLVRTDGSSVRLPFVAEPERIAGAIREYAGTGSEPA